MNCPLFDCIGFVKIKSNLHYTRAITPKRERVAGSSSRLSAWSAQLRRNAGALATLCHVSDLTDLGFELQISRTDSNVFRTEPTNCSVFFCFFSYKSFFFIILYWRSGIRFWAGHVGHRLATAPMFLRDCADQALSRGDGPRHPFTFRRNTASIMKI